MATPASGTTALSRRKAKVAIDRGQSTIGQEIGKGNITADQARIGGFNIPKVITSSDLQEQNPIVPIQPQPVTTQMGDLIPPADSFTQDLTRRTDVARQGFSKAQQDYLNAIIGQTSQVGLEDTLYAQKGGVDELQGELNTLNQQVLQEQLNLRQSLDELEKNREGFFGRALQDEINRVKTDSYKRQADLSIVQMGLQGRYDSAKAIADRSIQRQLESQKNYIDALKVNFDTYKDLFDKADQREFQVMINDREKALEQKYYQERARFDQILKQQDPLYQLQVMKARRELELVNAPNREEIEKTRTEAESLEGKKDLITGLLNSKAIDSVVGTSIFSRAAGGLAGVAGRFATGFAGGALAGTLLGPVGTIVGGVAGGLSLATQGIADTITGERQNFIAGVDQLSSQEFVDNLINVKAKGATFGALTDREGEALRNAATKLNSWKIEKDGKVVGYNTSEESFKAELNRIFNLTQKAYEKSTGNILTSDEEAFFENLTENSLSGFNAEQYYGF